MTVDAELKQKLMETKALAEAIASRLRDKGHDDSHKVIQLANELEQWIRQYNQSP